MSLFNLGKRQPFSNMFGRKNNNRGMIWGSLFSLGVGAAAIGLKRTRNRNMLKPISSKLSNTRIGRNAQTNMAGVTEFSKELLPSKNSLNNK